MRCPPFAYRAPATVDEALAILAGEGRSAHVLAGGTDLVPAMKRRHQHPATLVSIRRLDALRQVRQVGPDGAVELGMGLTLAALAAEPRLSAEPRWRALVEAAGSVATPHIRNAGTLGGNLCLDTRCNYYDQGWEWRRSIDFCLKEQGAICWVAPGSSRCWAVSSTDTAPALVALGAEVRIASAGAGGGAGPAERTMPVEELFHDDGIRHLALTPGDLLTAVVLPTAAAPDGGRWRSTYVKCRRRDAIDFPVLSVAAAVRLSPGDAASPGVVEEARIVLGAVSSRPFVTSAGALLVGHPLTPETIAAAAAAAAAHARPLDNTDLALGWRRRVAATYVTRALTNLAT